MSNLQFKQRTEKLANQGIQHCTPPTQQHMSQCLAQRDDSPAESLEVLLKVPCLGKVGRSVKFSVEEEKKYCYKQRKERRKGRGVLMSQRSHSYEKRKTRPKLPNFKQTSHSFEPTSQHAPIHPPGVIWASLSLSPSFCVWNYKGLSVRRSPALLWVPLGAAAGGN